MALSSAKIGGPAGVGALYVREGVELGPVSPGHQEWGLRGGTENLIGIVGFGAAARAAALTGEAEMTRLAPLTSELELGVEARIPGARVVGGEGVPRLANTAQFLVPHDDEEMLILALDRAGYAVSAGAACAAGAHERSHVLTAMGLLGPGLASVRVSLTYDTTREEIRDFIEAFASVMEAEALDTGVTDAPENRS
jgi:cysteine desulfurase